MTYSLWPKNSPEGEFSCFLDEIEYITFDISPSDHWSTDFLPFWQTVRSVHQDTKGRFGFVVVGVNPHIVEAERVGSYDNPLFSTAKPFYLGPFDLPTLRDMVRRIARYMGLQVAEPLFQRLFEEYGGHPFLVRQACSQLAKKMSDRPAEISTAFFEKEKASIALSLERNIRQVLNVLAIWYPDEYEMVRLLAHGDRPTFVAFSQASATFTEHVEGYGLVRDARGDARLSIGLVRDHLSKVPKSAGKMEADVSDPEAVLAEVSRRRNAIEVGLRVVLRDGLRFAEGQKAMQTALAALTEERRAVLSQYGYGPIWQELYFNELVAILDRNWAAFQKRFSTDKTKIAQWLDHINRCRVDAHARSLNPEDLAFLRVSFRRLEEILDIAT